MTKLYQQKLEHTLASNQSHPPKVEFAEAQASIPFLVQPLDECGSELATRPLPTCVRLDMEDLESFEVVHDQFKDLGVTFTNAVALTPSNPAYPTRSGNKVLIGAPKSGWLEATFLKPVRFVGGFVTSSRCAVLAAFDHENKPVAQAKSTSANLNVPGSKLPPNVQLSLTGENIHRIRFYSFDGQMTVDDFSFSF
ncbi:hypothetical protein H6G89_04860 [Oscillatoria sp. FACHB-1407]|uniref:hypothetical protein n=1 Tax=Oscillatoria sp. FACHB-1407 TaxID=2692847 RepID=UPI001688E6C7|nr:hypothetical protein [Oscillatoria sp. FACHB-1407]MBD2460368.1 hypothetical protein [Oscillatoria sp. FACHB-1407]